MSHLRVALLRIAPRGCDVEANPGDGDFVQSFADHARGVGACANGSGRMRVAAAALLCSALGGACGDGPAESGLVEVRDSAGVEIVEHSVGGWVAHDTWELATEPTVAIGVVEGPEEYQLFRVADGLRLPDGRILVVNAGTQELRVYGPDGRFIRAVGGEGEGPGEFRFPATVSLIKGDSLAVWDGQLQRVTVFGPNLEVGRQAASRGVLNPLVLGFYKDGGFVVAELWFDLSDPGYTDVPLRFYLRKADGTTADTLRTRPYGLFRRMEHVDMVAGPLFSPRTSMAWLPYGYAVGLKRRPEIEFYDRSGKFLRLVRWPDSDRRVTDRDVETYVEEQLATVSEDRLDAWTRHYNAIEVAESVPSYGDLAGDRLGNLWVQEYRREWTADDTPEYWWILGPDGRLTARISIEPGIRLLDLGPDWVLLVRRNDFDVEQVFVHSLVK